MFLFFLTTGNVKTYWRTYKTSSPYNGCAGTDDATGSSSNQGYPHCLDLSFATETAISRYSFSNYQGLVQPKSWELYGRENDGTGTGSTTWINVDKQSNVLWNSERYVTKNFWSNSETSTDEQYKYWKFKFLATDHAQYTQYVELSEINLFECEHKLLDGTTSDRAKGSDLITMKATKTTSTNPGNQYFFWFGSKTMQTDTNWLCKYASTSVCLKYPVLKDLC